MNTQIRKLRGFWQRSFERWRVKKSIISILKLDYAKI